MFPICSFAYCCTLKFFALTQQCSTFTFAYYIKALAFDYSFPVKHASVEAVFCNFRLKNKHDNSIVRLSEILH